MIAPSFDDLIAVGKAEAQTLRPDLQIGDGDVTEAMLHGSGAQADFVVGYAASGFRETFLDGAKGSALTARVADRESITRNEASAAQVTARFTRTSSGAGGSIPIGTRIGSNPDPDGEQIIYTTNAAVVVAAANNGPFDVLATCTEDGSRGNAAAGKVTNLLKSLFDTSFTVTNPAVAAGGNEEESDDALRSRARSFYSTLRRATLPALEQGALTVPSVAIATASEDPNIGLVTVEVTDSSGGSTLQMVSDVQYALRGYRGAGPPVQVVGGTAFTVDLTIIIAAYRPGFDVPANATLIANAITTRMNKLGAREILYLQEIQAAAISVAPDDVRRVDITSITINGTPAAIVDIDPGIGKVIRPQTITVT